MILVTYILNIYTSPSDSDSQCQQTANTVFTGNTFVFMIENATIIGVFTQTI